MFRKISDVIKRFFLKSSPERVKPQGGQESSETYSTSLFTVKSVQRSAETHYPYAHPLSTNSAETNSPLRNQRIPYSYIVQSSQRRSQNPPLSYILIDPVYQMNQHTTHNPTQISPTVNMAQSVVPSLQYIPIQQDTFINTSASLPEPMKPFDGLDHSYTPEEYTKL